LLGDFLVRGGHERIAFVAGAEDSSTNRDREAGFYKGLAQHGVTVFAHAVGGYSFTGAARATRELMALKRRPDAIFAANDQMAFSVMDVVRDEFCLRVPQDISIVGYDDVPQAAWKGYDLTTISQSYIDMVDITAKILIEQIENKIVKKRAAVLPAKLMIRTSARLPR
jgi:LacI family transcriptional regulator